MSYSPQVSLCVCAFYSRGCRRLTTADFNSNLICLGIREKVNKLPRLVAELNACWWQYLGFMLMQIGRVGASLVGVMASPLTSLLHPCVQDGDH